MIKAPSHVAVLMTAHNGMAFIEQQLQSILQQQAVQVSIFISVDLSTDNTYAWCRSYSQAHPEVTVLPYGEKFGSAAPNFFRLIREVDFSCFDYVAFSDQDDIWLKDKLKTACHHLKISNIDAYSSNVLAFWEDGRKHTIHKAQPQRKYDYLFEAAGPGCTYVLKTKKLLLFKKKLISHSHLAQQLILHDWAIYAFFRANGYQWFIDPVVKIHYRQHNNNEVGINKGWKSAIKRYQQIKQGQAKQQIALLINFIGLKGLNSESRLDVMRNISQLRRRPKDRAALFFLVLFGIY